jgi:hypothetical protein
LVFVFVTPEAHCQPVVQPWLFLSACQPFVQEAEGSWMVAQEFVFDETGVCVLPAWSLL